MGGGHLELPECFLCSEARPQDGIGGQGGGEFVREAAPLGEASRSVGSIPGLGPPGEAHSEHSLQGQTTHTPGCWKAYMKNVKKLLCKLGYDMGKQVGIGLYRPNLESEPLREKASTAELRGVSYGDVILPKCC